jgi:hypothetical protein
MTRGFATRTTAGSSDILAAPGAAVRYRVKHIIVTIDTIAVNGKVYILEGTTEKFGWDAVTAGSGQPPELHFPEGWPLELNAKLALKTEGAIEAFAYAAAETV